MLSGNAIRYGILAGAFNPPTEAHLALAHAALPHVDRVLFVLPRSLPHKDFSGVPFETRLDLLRRSTAAHPRFAVVTTAGGLFIEIARELRSTLPGAAELSFLCGRDAAERIVNWDYGSPTAFADMLSEFSLLVAPRGGDYQIPEQHKSRIAALPFDRAYDAISATDVRAAIREGRPWEHLIPDSIREQVRMLYPSGTGPNTP